MRGPPRELREIKDRGRMLRDTEYKGCGGVGSGLSGERRQQAGLRKGASQWQTLEAPAYCA